MLKQRSTGTWEVGGEREEKRVREARREELGEITIGGARVDCGGGQYLIGRATKSSQAMLFLAFSLNSTIISST